MRALIVVLMAAAVSAVPLRAWNENAKSGALVESEATAAVGAVHAHARYNPGGQTGGLFDVSYNDATRILDVEMKTDLYFESIAGKPQWTQSKANTWKSNFVSAVNKYWNGKVKIHCTPHGAAAYDVKIRVKVTPTTKHVQNTRSFVEDHTQMHGDVVNNRHFRILIGAGSTADYAGGGGDQMLGTETRVKQNTPNGIPDWYAVFHAEDALAMTGATRATAWSMGHQAARQFLGWMTGRGMGANVGTTREWTFDDIATQTVGTANKFGSAQIMRFADNIALTVRHTSVDACVPEYGKLRVTITSASAAVNAWVEAKLKAMGFPNKRTYVVDGTVHANVVKLSVPTGVAVDANLKIGGQVTVAHEFGHMLGNPDYYAPGITGFTAHAFAGAADVNRDKLYSSATNNGVDGQNNVPRQSLWLAEVHAQGLPIPVFGWKNSCFMGFGMNPALSDYAIIFKGFVAAVNHAPTTTPCHLVRA